jgi:hypothetical protein
MSKLKEGQELQSDAEAVAEAEAAVNKEWLVGDACVINGKTWFIREIGRGRVHFNESPNFDRAEMCMNYADFAAKAERAKEAAADVATEQANRKSKANQALADAAADGPAPADEDE